MIDGFRYAIIGYSDGYVGTGMVVITCTNIALWVAVLRLFKSGYRLKT
jgi:ABC-2 type transport system permease protein